LHRILPSRILLRIKLNRDRLAFECREEYHIDAERAQLCSRCFDRWHPSPLMTTAGRAAT
jgi:hypothetical protein